MIIVYRYTENHFTSDINLQANSKNSLTEHTVECSSVPFIIMYDTQLYVCIYNKRISYLRNNACINTKGSDIFWYLLHAYTHITNQQKAGNFFIVVHTVC